MLLFELMKVEVILMIHGVIINGEGFFFFFMRYNFKTHEWHWPERERERGIVQSQ